MPELHSHSREFNIASIIAPHFDDVFRAAIKHEYTHYWLDGGRGSTKSSFVAILLIILLLMHSDCHAVIMRKVGNTLKNSVFNQIIWAIEALGIFDKFKVKVSPMEIIYKPTGQKILFFGVDDKAKIKSIKVPFGYIGLTWYEELDQFAGMEEIRNLNQSLLRGGSKFWCFYSYNPPRSKDSWVNQEHMIDERDRLTCHTTYLGVPKEWLGEQFFYEAEKLKNKREELYRHEYLGEAIGAGGDVFDNVQEMEMSDEMVNRFDHVYYGIDFGFAVDPFAFIAVHYDKKHEELYIFDEIYQQKLSNRRASEIIKNKVGTRLITADSAEPKSIAEMRGYGLNIRGAKKGPDSVEYGISWLQHLNKIYIDKRRCPNAYREFVSYEYERNKDGEFISAYPDKNNHCLTADTIINTTCGNKTIKELVGTTGEVYCLNTNTMKPTIGKYNNCRMTIPNADIYELELADGTTIKGTADHPIYTQDGWKLLSELTDSDCIVKIEGL